MSRVEFPHGPGIIAGTDLIPPIRVRGVPGGDAAPLSPKHPRGLVSCDTMSPHLHPSRSPPNFPANLVGSPILPVLTRRRFATRSADACRRLHHCNGYCRS